MPRDNIDLKSEMQEVLKRVEETPSETATIDAALKLFGDDDRGTHICSALFDFGLEMRSASSDCAVLVGNIKHDLWNVSALLLRLQWMRGLAVQGELSIDNWRTFSSLDIENLFVQVRSSMDHSADLIRVHSPREGQLPGSFNKLYSSIKKYRSRLPSELQELIESAQWYGYGCG